MTYPEYIVQSRKALTRENIGSLNFLYEVNVKGNKAQFVWKKLMAADNIKVYLK